MDSEAVYLHEEVMTLVHLFAVSGVIPIQVNKTVSDTLSLGSFLSSEFKRVFWWGFGMFTWAFSFQVRSGLSGKTPFTDLHALLIVSAFATR